MRPFLERDAWTTLRRHWCNPEQPQTRVETPSFEHAAAIKAWFRVWHSLTKRQQNAWHALGRLEKDATYQMDAAAFVAFMKALVKTNRTPKKAPRPEPLNMPVLEAHNLILDGFEAARTEAKLDELARWGKENFDFTAEQEDQ